MNDLKYEMVKQLKRLLMQSHLLQLMPNLYPDHTFTTRPLVEALKTLKLIAVVPVALCVLHSELYAMRQDLENPSTAGYKKWQRHVNTKH